MNNKLYVGGLAYSVTDGQLQELEGIEILHFRFGPEFLGAPQSHADVGVAAQVPLFHIAGRDLDVLQALLAIAPEDLLAVGRPEDLVLVGVAAGGDRLLLVLAVLRQDVNLFLA